MAGNRTAAPSLRGQHPLCGGIAPRITQPAKGMGALLPRKGVRTKIENEQMPCLRSLMTLCEHRVFSTRTAESPCFLRCLRATLSAATSPRLVTPAGDKAPNLRARGWILHHRPVDKLRHFEKHKTKMSAKIRLLSENNGTIGNFTCLNGPFSTKS